jgi:RNA polymerase primary sigma factor
MTEAIQYSEPTETYSEPPSRVVGQGGQFGDRSIDGRDSVNLYLEEISKEPLLEADQEVELQKAIEAGLIARQILTGEIENTLSATTEELEWLAEEGDLARDQFLRANLRLVVSIARKYGRSQMPMLDLIQEGNTGLMRAVEKFDYTKGYKFSTYATWWVRQAVTRGIAQQARMVRLPVHVVEDLNQVGGVRRTLLRDLGREPEPHEIANELGIDTDRVVDLLAWGRDHVSLDQTVDDEGETSLGDIMNLGTAAGPDEEVVANDQWLRLNELIDLLDARIVGIIRLKYGLHDGTKHTLADIGSRYGISAERVRQLEREGLTKLRKLVADEGYVAEVERSNREKAAPKEAQPGKRAAERLEVAAKLQRALGRLSTHHAQILQAFADTRSQRVAAETLGMHTQTYGYQLKIARAALAAVSVE